VLEGYRISAIKLRDRACSGVILFLVLFPLDSINFIGVVIGLVYLLISSSLRRTN